MATLTNRNAYQVDVPLAHAGVELHIAGGQTVDVGDADAEDFYRHPAVELDQASEDRITAERAQTAADLEKAHTAEAPLSDVAAGAPGWQQASQTTLAEPAVQQVQPTSQIPTESSPPADIPPPANPDPASTSPGPAPTGQEGS